MTEYSQYYENNLYPLQNRILNILQQCRSPFYLTGGTALSRFYYNHRYSDDLDFFVNGFTLDDFIASYENSMNAFKENHLLIKFASDISSDVFRKLFVSCDNEPELKLKVEFINDTPVHYGAFKQVDVYRIVLWQL